MCDKVLALNVYKLVADEYSKNLAAIALRAYHFMTGKYAEAARFFDKLQQADEVLTSDWLNAGHVYLAQNNIPKALECYRQAENHCQSHDEFIQLYLADKEALLQQGISEENIYLVPDML
jgi:tetratricopeptide (TPR) repeat protein